MESIVAWMVDQQTRPNLVWVFQSYLIDRGTKTAVSLLHPDSSPLQMAARFHDCLRWDDVVEGRICALWVEMQAQEIHTQGLTRGADYWACGLMRRLLELSHCQCLYHNAMVHMKVKDGMTASQHDAVLAQMGGCLLIDPPDLLMEDQDLLDANFDKLSCGPTLDKLEWLAEIDTARGAADHIAQGTHHFLRSQYCSGSCSRMRTEHEDMLIDRDGRMKWQIRRKR